jgi:ornithine decarboxylase
VFRSWSDPKTHTDFREGGVVISEGLSAETKRVEVTKTTIDRVTRAAGLTPALESFLHEGHETPFLVVDVAAVEQNFRELQLSFPKADIHYAVKANPAPEILLSLWDAGCNFDVASPQEVNLCLHLGISASSLSYGNTIKKAKDIVYAYSRGVRLFAFDSLTELEKLAACSPGSKVMCRVLADGEGASWPLSRKFGCHPEMAVELLQLARKRGLKPYGLTFHVGSQQNNPYAWDSALCELAGVVSALGKEGIDLDVINIGGGLPAQYQEKIPTLDVFARTIQTALHTYLPGMGVMLEPGRSLVADAGVIQSEVVLISQKSKEDETRWVYLDIGKFNGLIETMDESIKYRLRTSKDAFAKGHVILAGPTCDSADILYEKTPLELPLNLAVGDRIEILSAGAYTSSYSSVGFNGFPPLKTYCIEE